MRDSVNIKGSPGLIAPTRSAVEAYSPGLLAARFESLGGSGHGTEFATFQRSAGAEANGLLAWADLAHGLLAAALEARFDGVGLPENTVVFQLGGSDEWWTRDKRYWMAMRSFVPTAGVGLQEATRQACDRIVALRDQLVADLTAGEKIFVFRSLPRDLTTPEIARLHAAIMQYGDGTFFYVRLADADHPAGTVEAPEQGLLIGFIERFAFSSVGERLGPVNDSWLRLCQNALSLREQWKPRPVVVAPPASQSPPPLSPPLSSLPAPPPAAPRPLQPRSIPRSARRIVLIGNCQMGAMAGLYNRFAARRRGDVVHHVESYHDLSDESRAAIQQADIVVEQLFDLKQRAETGDLARSAPRIFMPMVTAAFLWPFAGSPHPANPHPAFLPIGPYGAEASDSFLNRMIIAGTPPEEAVDAYLNLDVNGRVNLDRLFELVMDRQRRRDEAADFDIAGIIERHFRSEPLFRSPYHPNVRIATALAAQLFAKLDIDQDTIDRMRNAVRTAPFPQDELPIHPGVARHFELSFVSPDRRYRFLNEGSFTFREYALRYMRCEWNPALEEGMELMRAGKHTLAQTRLTDGLAISPQSAAGHTALAHVLNEQGDTEGALSSIRAAVALAPEAAACHASLGDMLRRTGQTAAAVQALRKATELEPVEPHYWGLLAHALHQDGDLPGAAEALRVLITLEPDVTSLKTALADILAALGDPAGETEALNDAAALEPDNAHGQRQPAALLSHDGEVRATTETAGEVLVLSPEVSSAPALESNSLLCQSDPADALHDAYAAAIAEPDNAHAYGQLGHVLRLTGDDRGAEAAFRHAARLAPEHPHFHHELSVLLRLQDRLDASIASARQAAELEPSNPNRLVHLASLLAHAGDLPAALTAARGAVAADPASEAFRSALSHLLGQARDVAKHAVPSTVAVDL